MCAVLGLDRGSLMSDLYRLKRPPVVKARHYHSSPDRDDIIAWIRDNTERHVGTGPQDWTITVYNESSIEVIQVGDWAVIAQDGEVTALSDNVFQIGYRSADDDID